QRQSPERRRQVRVKRWGKSPPADRVTGRPGKPRPEQDQIGGRFNGGSPSPRVSVARGAGQPAPQTDGHRPARDTEPGLCPFSAHLLYPQNRKLWARRLAVSGFAEPKSKAVGPSIRAIRGHSNSTPDLLFT